MNIHGKWHYCFWMLVFLLPVFTPAVAQSSWKFDFGNGKVKKGYRQVLPGTIYSSQTGYGFEPGAVLGTASVPGDNYLTTDHIFSLAPFYFSVKVPEGNYRVKVTLGDKVGTSRTTIKAESRRLMVELAATKKGEFVTREFIVHVRDSIIRPSQTKVRLKAREIGNLHWDDKLTLEFSNDAPKLCALEISRVNDVPTLFLAGNSTVVDQANEPYASWGQMIPAFFKGDKVAVANYAESGETLRSFKGARRLEKIWSMAKAGDYLFIEFAHNDQKPGSNHLDPFTTYKQTVREWIAEARKRGMHPVLVTSTHRRSFDSLGRIQNTLGDYPAALLQTGREEGIPVIDLNAMSKTLWEALGPEGSKKAFVHYPANSFPNQPNALSDNTHFSTYGAYELAKCIVTGIRQHIPALARFICDGLPVFDPARPSPVSEWKLPLSNSIEVTKPDGN